MRPQLDLDGDLAGRRGHSLADPDRNPGGDVFARAQRGAAGGAARAAARRPSRVERAGGRAGRARTQSEPIQTETAAEFIEHPGAATGERGGGRGELKSFAGAELTDATVEQHARQDLVLRHGRGRAQRHFWRRDNSADLDLCGNIGGARLSEDIEGRVELCAALECDPAARYCESLAQQIDAAADLLERSVDRWRRAGAGDCQLAAPLAVEPLPAYKDIAGQVDLYVEGCRQRRCLIRGGGRRQLGRLAIGFDDF